MSLAELAALASDVSGDRTATSRSSARSGSPTAARLGRPEWSIEAGISFYDGVARGEADVVSDDYRELTGRKAMSVRDLLELYRDDLPLGRKRLHMTRAVILSAVRTPVGRYGGGLADVRPDDLAATVIAEAVARAGVPAAEIEDVWLGCANQAGEDNRNVARFAALLAGLPESVGWRHGQPPLRVRSVRDRRGLPRSDRRGR